MSVLDMGKIKEERLRKVAEAQSNKKLTVLNNDWPTIILTQCSRCNCSTQSFKVEGKCKCGNCGGAKLR